MTLTEIAAGWGALLSTVLGVWTLLKDYNDKGKIEVRPFICKMTNDPSNSDHVLVEIVNVGRRPVNVTSLCATVKGSQMNLFVVADSLPKMLHEQERIHQEIDIEIVDKEVGYFFVNDAKGKEWRVKEIMMNKYKEMVRKARERQK